MLSNIRLPHHLQNLSHIVVKNVSESMKTVPGLLAEPADTGAKNLLPSSTNPSCLSPASPSGETESARLPQCHWC